MKNDFWDTILELFYDEEEEGFTLDYLNNYIFNLHNTNIKPYYLLLVLSGALMFASSKVWGALNSLMGGLFGTIAENGEYIAQDSYIPFIGFMLFLVFLLNFIAVVWVAPFVIVKCKGYIAVPKGEYALSSQVYGWGFYSLFLYPIALIHAMILPPNEKK